MTFSFILIGLKAYATALTAPSCYSPTLAGQCTVSSTSTEWFSQGQGELQATATPIKLLGSASLKFVTTI